MGRAEKSAIVPAHAPGRSPGRRDMTSRSRDMILSEV
jgi:hypothetical protein